MDKATLMNATERSVENNQIVNIACDDVANSLRWLESIANENELEFSSVKNGDTWETWASEEGSEGDMIWRVHLICEPVTLGSLPDDALVSISHPTAACQFAKFLVDRGFGECLVEPVDDPEFYVEWEWQFVRCVDKEEAGNAHHYADAYLRSPYQPLTH